MIDNTSGFRPDTPWKWVVTVVGCLAIAGLLLGGLVTRDPAEFMLGMVTLAIVLLASDAWGLRRRSPLIGSSSQVHQLVGWAFLLAIWLILCSMN